MSAPGPSVLCLRSWSAVKVVSLDLTVSNRRHEESLNSFQVSGLLT